MIVWGIAVIFTTLAVAAWAIVPSQKAAPDTSNAAASRLVGMPMAPLGLMIEAENMAASGWAGSF